VSEFNVPVDRSFTRQVFPAWMSTGKEMWCYAYERDSWALMLTVHWMICQRTKWFHSIDYQIQFDLIFPITILYDTMPLYKYLKFLKFKHTRKH